MQSYAQIVEEIDEKDPDSHIHIQLSKAADQVFEEVKGKDGFKTKGGADVDFDEKTVFVRADMAKKVVSELSKLKPADRDKLHGHIQKSFANLQAVYRLIS